MAAAAAWTANFELALLDSIFGFAEMTTFEMPTVLVNPANMQRYIRDKGKSRESTNPAIKLFRISNFSKLFGLKFQFEVLGTRFSNLNKSAEMKNLRAPKSISEHLPESKPRACIKT